MRIKFNRTGAERKALVTAMGEILGASPRYLGMPTAAYEVDYCHVDKNGTVEFDDRADSKEVERLLEELEGKGFVGESEAPAQETSMGFTVTMPKALFTDAALENLAKLLDAKGSLIKKALNKESLPIEISDETVSFPWFSGELTAEEVKAYTHLVTALCDMARTQKRVTTKAKEVDNDKYAFRCFLIRMGFIGPDYKMERKILLKNLSGSSAFKHSAKPKAEK